MCIISSIHYSEVCTWLAQNVKSSSWKSFNWRVVFKPITFTKVRQREWSCQISLCTSETLLLGIFQKQYWQLAHYLSSWKTLLYNHWSSMYFSVTWLLAWMEHCWNSGSCGCTDCCSTHLVLWHSNLSPLFTGASPVNLSCWQVLNLVSLSLLGRSPFM